MTTETEQRDKENLQHSEDDFTLSSLSSSRQTTPTSSNQVSPEDSKVPQQ
jgi:hypothetical protein